jgi:hypothetical protein
LGTRCLAPATTSSITKRVHTRPPEKGGPTPRLC